MPMPAMTPAAEIAGPVGLSPADARLLALKDHQAKAAAAPTPEELGADPSLAKALLPLVLAQGLDLLSTEAPTGFLRYPNTNEANPLPGMQSTPGRLGWGALETALIGLLLKKAPEIGMPARNALAGTHSALVLNNEAIMRQKSGVNADRATIIDNMLRSPGMVR
jgi:hypothetical protein